MTTLLLSIMTNMLLNQNTNFKVGSVCFFSFLSLRTSSKLIIKNQSYQNLHCFAHVFRSAATKNLDELSSESDQTTTYIDTTVAARGSVDESDQTNINTKVAVGALPAFKTGKYYHVFLASSLLKALLCKCWIKRC